MIFRQYIHNFRQSERSVNHIKSASVFQYSGSLAYHILQITKHLMSCNSFGHIRISQSMLSYHIWRITCYHIKRSRSKNISSLFDISLYNLHIFFQMIILYTAAGHLCTFLLNLQTCKMLSLSLCFQKNRNNTGSCTHVQRSFTLFHFCKARKKNSIHTKAEFIRILYYIITILQIINPLFFPDQLLIHLIWNLPFYPPDLQVPLILYQKPLLFSCVV